jgi:hypothetical protein
VTSHFDTLMRTLLLRRDDEVAVLRRIGTKIIG